MPATSSSQGRSRPSPIERASPSISTPPTRPSGSSMPSPVCRPRAGARLRRPLHPSDRHLEPAVAESRRETGALPLHRLPPPRRLAPEDHGAGRDGIHSPRPPPRAPDRLPPHPLLRPARPSPTTGEPDAGSAPARDTTTTSRGPQHRVHRLSGSLSGIDRTLVAAVSAVRRRGDARRRLPRRPTGAAHPTGIPSPLLSH